MKISTKTTLLLFGFLMMVTNLKAEDKNNSQNKIETAIERLMKKCGNENEKSVLISRDPATGALESKYIITPIKCKKGNSSLKDVIHAFEKVRDFGLGYTSLGPCKDDIYKTTVEGNMVSICQKGQSLRMIIFKNEDDPRLLNGYTLAYSENEKGVVTGTAAIITMNRSEYTANNNFGLSDDVKKRNKKFVIDGIVDPEIADSCYNIYIADIDGNIGETNLVAEVPVVDKRFRYEVELDEIKNGRIRAIFPGDELCSAWIDLKFVPDFTLKLSVHDGYYNIINQNSYNEKCNKALKEYQYQNGLFDIDFLTIDPFEIENKNKRNHDESFAEETNKFILSFESYRQLNDQLSSQLDFTLHIVGVTYNFKESELKKIDQQMDENFNCMQNLIAKLSSTIDESDINANKLAMILDAYQKLLDMLKKQMSIASNMVGVSYNFKEKRLNGLSEQLNLATKRMRILIDKYASTISQSDMKYLNENYF